MSTRAASSPTALPGISTRDFAPPHNEGVSSDASRSSSAPSRLLVASHTSIPGSNGKSKQCSSRTSSRPVRDSNNVDSPNVRASALTKKYSKIPTLRPCKVTRDEEDTEPQPVKAKDTNHIARLSAQAKVAENGVKKPLPALPVARLNAGPSPIKRNIIDAYEPAAQTTTGALSREWPVLKPESPTDTEMAPDRSRLDNKPSYKDLKKRHNEHVKLQIPTYIVNMRKPTPPRTGGLTAAPSLSSADPSDGYPVSGGKSFPEAKPGKVSATTLESPGNPATPQGDSRWPRFGSSSTLETLASGKSSGKSSGGSSSRNSQELRHREAKVPVKDVKSHRATPVPNLSSGSLKSRRAREIIERINRKAPTERIDRNAPGVTTHRLSAHHGEYGPLLITDPEADKFIIGIDGPPTPPPKNSKRDLESINERVNQHTDDAGKRNASNSSPLSSLSEDAAWEREDHTDPALAIDGGSPDVTEENKGELRPSTSKKVLHNSTLAMLEGTHANAQPLPGTEIDMWAGFVEDAEETGQHRSRSESLAKLESKGQAPTIHLDSPSFVEFAQTWARRQADKALNSEPHSGYVYQESNESGEGSFPLSTAAAAYTPSVYNITPTITQEGSDRLNSPDPSKESITCPESAYIPPRSAFERAQSYMNVVSGSFAHANNEHEQQTKPSPTNSIDGTHITTNAVPNRTSSLYLHPIRQSAPPPGRGKPPPGPSALRHVHSPNTMDLAAAESSNNANKSSGFVDSPSLQMLENATSRANSPENYMFTSVGPNVVKIQKSRDSIDMFKDPDELTPTSANGSDSAAIQSSSSKKSRIPRLTALRRLGDRFFHRKAQDDVKGKGKDAGSDKDNDNGKPASRRGSHATDAPKDKRITKRHGTSGSSGKKGTRGRVQISSAGSPSRPTNKNASGSRNHLAPIPFSATNSRVLRRSTSTTTSLTSARCDAAPRNNTVTHSHDVIGRANRMANDLIAGAHTLHDSDPMKGMTFDTARSVLKCAEYAAIAEIHRIEAETAAKLAGINEKAAKLEIKHMLKAIEVNKSHNFLGRLAIAGRAARKQH